MGCNSSAQQSLPIRDITYNNVLERYNTELEELVGNLKPISCDLMSEKHGMLKGADEKKSLECSNMSDTTAVKTKQDQNTLVSKNETGIDVQWESKNKTILNTDNTEQKTIDETEEMKTFKERGLGGRQDESMQDLNTTGGKIDTSTNILLAANDIHEKTALSTDEEVDKYSQKGTEIIRGNGDSHTNISETLTELSTVKESDDQTLPKDDVVYTGTDIENGEGISTEQEDNIIDGREGEINDSQLKINDTDEGEKTGESRSLTKEQSELVSQGLLNKLKEAIDSLQDTEWIQEDGEIAPGVSTLVESLNYSYSVLRTVNAAFSCIKDTREKVAALMLESKTVDKICKLIVYSCEKMPVSEYKKENNDLHFPVHMSMHVFGNYTDTSQELAERIANYPGFLSVLHRIQKDFTEAQFKETEQHQDDSDCLCGKCIVDSALCMIHNISMVESTAPLLRNHNFVEVLQPYLKSKDKADHLTALATLAAIVDEKESEIINSNKKVVKYLMKTLRRGLKKEERRYNGWSCKECGLTIKTLARNDANKKLLVQLGALKLLVKLSKGNIDEQSEAVGAIWALSFDDDNRKVMIETEKLNVIKTLSDLRDNDCGKIKTAANGALWNLRQDLRKSNDPTYQEIGRSFMPDAVTSHTLQKRLSNLSIKNGDEGGHIFISYQWSNQRVLIDIRNELIRKGFNVWMDVDNMTGSTLQAMAEAVEDADIVLVCFSQKYKNSPNCRAEAEYTFQRQKHIIPLRMEQDYKPDGWLGILIGTKLFYDFSGKYNFADKLNKLLKEVAAIKRQMQNDAKTGLVPKKIEPLYHSIDRVDGPTVEQAPDMYRSAKHATNPRDWSSDDLRNWIKKHNLPEETCGSLTCDELALLLKMMNEAPESFYNGLQRKFNYDFKVISQLVRALEDIDK